MSLSVGLTVFIISVGLLICFAVLSNVFVIYSVMRYRKLRTVTNIFICNLAVTDILLSGFVMPQKLHDISHEDDFYEGEFLCKVVNFTPIFIITSSIYTLVCVSFERKRAIMESNETQFTISFLKKIIPFIWIFGLLVSLPTLIEYRVNNITIATSANSSKALLSCGSQHMTALYAITNAIFVALVSYVVPVILMFNNYIRVAVFLWRKGKQITAASHSNGHAHGESFQMFRNKFKIVKLLVVVAVIFAVSWFPFFVTLLYAKISSHDASNDASGFVNLFLIVLATFSTVYNVVLYVLYNPGFTRALQQLVRYKPQASHINDLDQSRLNTPRTISQHVSS